MIGNKMEDNKKAKLILDYSQNKDTYSDGEVENILLDIFKSRNSKDKIDEILNNDPIWAMRYHLSPERENLLSWYDFTPGSDLLEIGAGCGALTGMFCKKLKNVVAVELTEKRSSIILERHKDKNNLTIYAGNFNDIKLVEKFDYITLIGVLEYAGMFTHTNNPAVDFLKSIKKYIKDNGTIIVAIENKFGLKYWSGVREDHTGRFFDSIEDYPKSKDIKTFGKEELVDLIKESGFNNVDFYYPVPDYKLPTEIFSDNYLPNMSHNLKPSVYPFKDLSNRRDFLFNEKLAMDNIIKNRQFDFFANSFLVFIKQ